MSAEAAPGAGMIHLRVRDLHAWYGESHVLHGVDLEVPEGHVVTILGRNGAGKSTTLKSIMGMMKRRSGDIAFNGRDISHLRAFDVARLGIAFCPEDRGIFSGLSVRENLLLPPVVADGGIPVQTLYHQFPNLAASLDRPGTRLSGGEQQMLAIARILRTGARFLLLDEPTEGLAPVIVKQIGRTLAQLKRDGYTILLVEQNYRFASQIADSHFVMEHGRVIDRIDRSQLKSQEAKLLAYLGV